jgi:plastocyanin domain-containing protein
MGLGLAACNKSGDDKTAAKPVDGVVAITADETGFHPDNIALKQGEKATLRFTRTTDETCADKVVFPELKIEKDLPLQQAVDIPIEATEARTLGFQCGMGMFKSKVVIR